MQNQNIRYRDAFISIDLVCISIKKTQHHMPRGALLCHRHDELNTREQLFVHQWSPWSRGRQEAGGRQYPTTWKSLLIEEASSGASMTHI